MHVLIFTTLKDRILKGYKNNSKKQEGKLNYLHSKLEACGAFQQILQQLSETPIPNEQGCFTLYLGMDTGHFVLF